jgi:hypothetical protein
MGWDIHVKATHSVIGGRARGLLPCLPVVEDPGRTPAPEGEGHFWAGSRSPMENSDVYG